MLVLGEMYAMAGKRRPDLLRRFGCRGLRDPHRIDRTRRRPAFGERVCLRQCCRADRRDGQDEADLDKRMLRTLKATQGLLRSSVATRPTWREDVRTRRRLLIPIFLADQA